jgi:cytochrome oxidase Cu insertion factor (SCO1/SenC/PrrC family)
MYTENSHSRATLSFLLICLLLSACNTASRVAPTEASRPDWFSIPLTDVRTGESFTVNDFDGKVVLLETMAMWCPNCIMQGGEVRKLHELLGNPDDLISVSLDVDLHEDEASLKEYTQEFGFDWHFVVAPLELQRDIGNLYTAQYLNPPLSPMMIIDRDGNVHHLDYGLKEAETLKEKIEPYLAP